MGAPTGLASFTEEEKTSESASTSLSLFAHPQRTGLVRTQQKVAACNLGREAFTRNQPCLQNSEKSISVV